MNQQSSRDASIIAADRAELRRDMLIIAAFSAWAVILGMPPALLARALIG